MSIEKGVIANEYVEGSLGNSLLIKKIKKITIVYVLTFIRSENNIKGALPLTVLVM